MGAAEPAAAARLWVALLAGVSGGVCNVLVGHPFDTIKVRAQAGRPLFQGSLLTGILGQLLGVSPIASRVIMACAVFSHCLCRSASTPAARRPPG